METPRSSHEGFAVLIGTKGAGRGHKTSEWRIDQHRRFFAVCWRLGGLGRAIIAAVATLRWTSVFSFEVFNRTIVVDLKGSIARDIRKSGVLEFAQPEVVSLRYRRWRTFLGTLRVARLLQVRFRPTCPEDFHLLVLYSWFYSAISNSRTELRFSSLLVAKDISPLSGALISIARDRDLPIGVYSLPGMNYEPGIGKNCHVFAKVFVASRHEASLFEPFGKAVHFSSLPCIPPRLKPIGTSRPVVGVLLSSNRNWDWSTALQRIEGCIGNIMRAYEPGEVVLRAHPDERDIVREAFRARRSNLRVDDGTLEEFCHRVDFVVGSGTTAAIQVLEAGKIVLFDPAIDCDYPRGPLMFNEGVLFVLGEEYAGAATVNAYYESDGFRAKLADLFPEPPEGADYRTGLASLLSAPGTGR